MPRGVAHGPEIRSFLMGLHVQGRSLSDLSREFGIPREVLSRWWQRVQADGLSGLAPRSRRPLESHPIPRRVVRRILELRRRRLGPARIAPLVGVSAKTVHRVLTRQGQARLPRPRRRPSRRYEKSRPGELLHVDIKVLPARRNARYDYEFAAGDDFSREAVVAITTEQTSAAATTFLEQVVTRLPYPVEAVLTDNALAFTMKHAWHSDRLTRFEQACQSLGICPSSAPSQTAAVERQGRALFPHGRRRMPGAPTPMDLCAPHSCGRAIRLVLQRLPHTFRAGRAHTRPEFRPAAHARRSVRIGGRCTAVGCIKHR